MSQLPYLIYSGLCYVSSCGLHFSARVRDGDREMNWHLGFCGRAATALLALALCWQVVNAAPAPIDRSASRNKHLCRDDLVGHWSLIWSGQRYDMTLSAAGDYECQCGGMTYVGVWSLDNAGRFWISESTTYNPSFCQIYAVRLDPWTLSGRVEMGSPGTAVQLVRLR